MRMGLREANQQFAKAIRAVKAGHEVVLTERGKPVAVIKAWRSDAGRDAIHRRLLAAGLISRAPQPGRLRRIRPIRIKGEPISKTLERMRDEDEH
jgi:antitoxin (DNA-binding transcriptional repressor) of toxin-antitoxin stability system